MQREPPCAYWQGKPLALTKAHFAILYLLCARREVSHFGIEMAGSGTETAGSSCKVQISLLRKRLPRGLAIESIHGWGYRLNLEDDDMPDIKGRIVDTASAAPDDALGAVLITVLPGGKVSASMVNTNLLGAARILTEGSRVVLEKMARPAEAEAQ